MERRVLVTGASRGIGRAIAEALARTGFTVALNFRASGAAAEAVAQGIRAAGGKAELLPFDVASSAARAVLEADVAARGAFWGVVLNAGITADGPLAGMKEEQWTSVLRTNLDGFYHVLQPLVLPMVGLRAGGRIVTISSVSGLRGNKGQTNYAASKAGLIGFTKSLAREIGSRNVRVNAIAPGFITTELTDVLPEAQRDRLRASTALGRLGEPEDIARCVRFLASDASAFITGCVIAVDGGLGM